MPNDNERPLQLVLQTAFLGDLLLSIGLLKAVRARHPERRLGLVCREKLGDFFLKTGLVDETFEIRKGDRQSYRELAARLRARKIAGIYCPHGSIRTALFAWSLGADDSVAFRKSWNAWAFRRRVDRPDAWPDVLRQLSLLAPEDQELTRRLREYSLGGLAFARDENGRLSEVPPWASISLRDRYLADETTWRRLNEKLGELTSKPLALIFPGSVWATKRWTEEGFAQVGRELANRGMKVVLMGAGNEVALAESVANRVPGAVSAAGKTDLYESAILLSRAKVMIGNDSASIHLAATAETKLVTVFGPTVIEQGFRPWSNSSTVVDVKGLSCRPCGPHGHHKCPRGTHECMKNVTADDVLRAVTSTLLP